MNTRFSLTMGFYLAIVTGCLLPSLSAAAENKLRPAEARQLQQIRTLMEKASWQEAEDSLNKLWGEEQGNALSSKAQYLVALSLGQVAIQRDHYPAALTYFEKAYEISGKESEEGKRLLYNIGQLQCHEAQWVNCRQSLEAWSGDKSTEVPADVFVMIAQAYAMTEDWAQVIGPIRAARNARKKTAPVSWYQMEVSAWVALEKWREAIAAQEALISAHPDNPSSWRYLVELHRQHGRVESALAAHRLGRSQGFLVEQQDEKRLVWLYAEQGLPYYAAETLKQAMEAGRLPEDLQNLRWQFQFLQQSRETDQAINVLDKLHRLEPQGRWSAYKTEIQIKNGLWADAERSLLEQKRSHSGSWSARQDLLLATVRYHLGESDKARDGFLSLTHAESNSDKQTRQRAGQWLRFLDQTKA